MVDREENRTLFAYLQGTLISQYTAQLFLHSLTDLLRLKEPFPFRLRSTLNLYFGVRKSLATLFFFLILISTIWQGIAESDC